MRKIIMSLGIAIAAIAAGCAQAGATTTSTTTGAGTYQVTGATVRSATPVGTSTLIDQTLFIDNAGVLSGPSSADVLCLIKVDGSGACAGIERFTGTIGGRTGSANFAVALTIDATGFHGTFVALTSSGGLRGLAGYGTFEGGSSGTNSFTYSFAS